MLNAEATTPVYAVSTDIAVREVSLLTKTVLNRWLLACFFDKEIL